MRQQTTATLVTLGLTFLVLVISPACGGGGGRRPTEVTCTSLGAAVSARIQPSSGDCDTMFTAVVTVTNNTCGQLLVQQIDESMVGTQGPCTGAAAEFTESIQQTLVQGETREFTLTPWMPCSEGGPDFTCRWRDDVTVRTDQGQFSASTADFEVLYDAKCESCESLGAASAADLGTPICKGPGFERSLRDP